MNPQVRWFRRLLKLLPADFQADYARDMERTFVAQQRDAERLEGARGLARLWWETLRDVIRTAPREHADQLAQDARYAVRGMRRRPAATAAALATLAVGMGGVTAIASLVNGVDWRPLDYPAPDRVVFVQEVFQGDASETTGWATFADWRARSRSFAALAAVGYGSAAVSGAGDPEQLSGMRVTPEFFRVIGVEPALGRPFTAGEDRWANRRFVVISDGLWHRRFAADPSVVGRTIQLGGHPYVVTGVMPAFSDAIGEQVFDGADYWVPLAYDATLPFACRTCRHLRVIGRLGRGVEAGEAQSEIEGIMRQLAAEHRTSYAGEGARVVRAADHLIGPVRPALYLPFAAVCVLLLIAASNVSNLQVVWAIERRAEISMRRALGVGTGRLVRQLLTETLVLAALGGLAGVAVAWAALRLLVASAPATLPRVAEVGIDGWMLALTFGLSALVGVVFGLVPAWHLAADDVAASLRGSAPTVAGSRGRTARLLVAGNVAMAVVLLVVTGLLGRSFARLMDVDPGFEPEGVVTANVDLSGPAYAEDAAAHAFWRRLLDEVRGPGVDAALTSQIPIRFNDGASLHVDGRLFANPEDAPSADRFAVTPDYFRTLRIPVLRGRVFTDADAAGAQPVALVNQAVVDRVFGGRDPVGERIMLGPPDGPKRTIVGVVGDIHHRGLGERVTLQAYVPQTQFYQAPMWLVVRGDVGLPQAAARVRAAVRRIDGNQAVHAVRTYESLLSESVAERRYVLLLVGWFSGAALLLAAVGLYGVLSHVVAGRTREIGLRVALGAARTDIRRLVVSMGMGPVAAGLVAGLVFAAATSRLVESFLFSIEASDPIAVGGAVLVLTGVALVACLVPARRATRVDPMAALRVN